MLLHTDLLEAHARQEARVIYLPVMVTLAKPNQQLGTKPWATRGQQVELEQLSLSVGKK